MFGLQTFEKAAKDVLDYYVDWRTWLLNDPATGSDDDTILDSRWSVSPTGVLLTRSSSFSSGITSVLLIGGQENALYIVTNTIDASNGVRTIEESRSFQIFITKQR